MTAAPPIAGRRPDGAGAFLKALRSRRGLSQLELALEVGVSQRHLSCVETGRARASRELLLALLDALDAPLSDRNDVLLAAGFAPAYGRRELGGPDMEGVRDALSRLLAAHEPAPALVLDGAWRLVQANRGATALARLLGLGPDGLTSGTNLLKAMLVPGALRDALVNRDELCAEAWRRAVREADHLPALRAVVEELRPRAPRPRASVADAPLLLTRLRTRAGELRFFSAFTTFGAPLDVTIASMRVEHMFPADEETRRALERAAARLRARRARPC